MPQLFRLGVAAAMAAFALFGFSVPAWAHAEVTRTSPQAGSTVHANLTRITVTFDEAVTLVPHALRLTTDRGIPVNLESPRLSDHGKVLSANVQDHLASGRYAVAWRVQADDGHLETSTFGFSVGRAAGGAAPATSPTVPPVPDEPRWPVAVAIAIALVGGLAAGIAVRRGLRLVRAVPIVTDDYSGSPRDHETLRLPM